MLKCRPKTRGAATSSKPSRPLIALCEEREIPERLLARLRRLDAEQLQIIEMIAVAISRGAVTLMCFVA